MASSAGVRIADHGQHVRISASIYPARFLENGRRDFLKTCVIAGGAGQWHPPSYSDEAGGHDLRHQFQRLG